MLPVAILMGGLGTRVRPLTETKPKALIPVGDEPFLAHQMRLLHSNGVERVVLCVGYLGEQIQAFLEEHGTFGLEVQYSWDGPVAMGTAGALRRACDKLGDAFAVIYGDSYLPTDYRAAERAFLASGKLSLMTVFKNEGMGDTSNVHFADGSILAYDKKNINPNMRYIDYGLGFFQSKVFREMSDGPRDLAGVYQEMLAKHELAALEVSERFYEAGSFNGIGDLADYLSEQTSKKESVR